MSLVYQTWVGSDQAVTYGEETDQASLVVDVSPVGWVRAAFFTRALKLETPGT